MLRRGAVAATLAAVCMGAVACGGEKSALEQTEANMAKLDSGSIDLRLAATAGTGDSESGPVGFRLQGPFSVAGDTDLAVFDLTYTQLLGDDTKVTKVSSTGEAAFVDVGSKTYRVPDDELGSLRLADDPSGGFGDLGIAGWVKNAKTKKSGQTETITGDVDAADLLSDLARVAGPIGGDDQLSALSGDAAERLQRLVKSSSITVVTGAEDRQLRSLHAVIDFGTEAPTELRRTLGKYADAHLDIRLGMKKLTSALRVEAPADYDDR